MIEAELKARAGSPEALSAALGRLARGEPSTYRDTYCDTPDTSLSGSGRELRVRVIEAGATRRTILTYKEPAADEASQSKPEHETMVASDGVVDVILSALGDVRAVLGELGVAEDDLTTDTYTGAVMRVRGIRQ